MTFTYKHLFQAIPKVLSGPGKGLRFDGGLGVRKFASGEYEGLVQEAIASLVRSDEWSAALSDALTEEANTKERTGAQQRVGQMHDREALFHAIASTMCERLGPTCRDRLEDVVGEASPLPTS